MFVLGDGCSCSVVCRCFVEIVEPILLLAVVLWRKEKNEPEENSG